MKLRDLRVKHPSYDQDWLDRSRDLFEGGARMQKHADRHLIQNDVEPSDLFRRRCKASHYLNYCGPAGAYFGAFVGTSAVTFSAGGDYWDAFSKNADGLGADFNTSLVRLLVEAMVTQTAWLRVSFPQPKAAVESLADVRAQGVDRALVSPIKAEQVIDWEKDDAGRYLWVRECEQRQIRRGTGLEPETVATWTEWRQDGSASRWAITWKGEQAPGDAEEADEVAPPFNPTGRMPLVPLELPQSLYLMGHMASPQTESFRKRAALSWAIDRTCYAMPAFFLVDAKKPPTMGTGYYLILGEKDRLEWPAPPSAPFQVIGEYADTLVQEMHRISQTMARGVDNNAAAVGRSGESKQADNQSTEIVVKAYADILREAAQQTVDIVAAGAGQTAPQVGGLCDYKVTDATLSIENFIALDTVTLHSVTAKRHIEKRAMRAYMPNLPEEEFGKIDSEIDKTLTPEELDRSPPEPVIVAPGDEPPTDEE